MINVLTEWPDFLSTSYELSIIKPFLNHINGGDGFPVQWTNKLGSEKKES